ncbi:MAG: GntR family transcriptional regulator [Pseudomonadales bacterium]|nr:GntR family transcriptional regulator [Pseudomonadales bacterium]
MRVARCVAELVERLDVKPGEKLPFARDLAEMREGSRATIRKTMIDLDVAGLIEIGLGYVL